MNSRRPTMGRHFSPHLTTWELLYSGILKAGKEKRYIDHTAYFIKTNCLGEIIKRRNGYYKNKDIERIEGNGIQEQIRKGRDPRKPYPQIDRQGNHLSRHHWLRR